MSGGPSGNVTTFSGPSFSHRHGGMTSPGGNHSGNGNITTFSPGRRGDMASAVMSHHHGQGSASSGVQQVTFMSRHGGASQHGSANLATFANSAAGTGRGGSVSGNIGAAMQQHGHHAGAANNAGGGNLANHLAAGGNPGRHHAFMPGTTGGGFGGGQNAGFHYRPNLAMNHGHHGNHGGNWSNAGGNWNQSGSHHHHHGSAFIPWGLWSPFGFWGSPFGWNSAFYRPWYYGNYYYGYGYGGYGYPWQRYGWRTSGYYPAYQSVCSTNPAYYTTGYLYQPVLATGVAAPPAATTVVAAATPEAAVAATSADQPAADGKPTPDGKQTSDEAKRSSEAFAQQGELQFKLGQYDEAAYAFRHALVDDPDNGVLMLLLSQSLFADGKFTEAAGAVQVAMLMLPEDKWGVVIENYTELYNDNQKYTDQLRALEKARKEKPDEPGLRFLLGYQYAYLGYASHAVKELDKAIEQAPKDELAAKLRDLMQAKLGKTDAAESKPAETSAAETPSAEPAVETPSTAAP